MTRARIVILVLAVSAAGLAIFLASNLMTPQEAPSVTVVETRPLASVETLVATENIPPGARFEPGKVRWQLWPEDGVNESYIVRDQSPDMPDAITGHIARLPLVAGEPVTREKIVDPGQGGFMAAMITAGMRAVSVAVAPETSAGGFIIPGDRVDVVLTRRVDPTSNEMDFGGYEARTILTNVRVLAIDQTFGEVEGEQVVVGKTATVELTPPQAEILALGEAAGSLSLALRSLASVSGDGYSSAPDYPPNTIRVIRFGAASILPVKERSQ